MKNIRFLTFVLTITTLLLSACGAAAVTPAVSKSTVATASAKVVAMPVAFIGIVDSIAGDQWVISGTTVTVDPAIVRDGPFNAGDRVKVEGFTLADGSLTLSRVEAPTPQETATSDDNSNDAATNANTNDANTNDDNSNTANTNDDNSNTANSNDDNGGGNTNDDNSNTSSSNDDSNVNDDNGNDGNSNDDNGGSNSNDDNSGGGSNSNDDNGGSNSNDDNSGGSNSNDDNGNGG